MVKFKQITPKQLKTDVFRLQLLNAMRRMGTQMRRDMQRTVSTWEGDKPTFDQQISLSPDGPNMVVYPTGPEMGVKKWHWLDKGTKIRYATMSRDWQSKTTPKSLDSGRGRGHVLFVNRKHPRPGIKARGWTKLMAKKWKKPFAKEMLKAMAVAAAQSGHGMR